MLAKIEATVNSLIRVALAETILNMSGHFPSLLLCFYNMHFWLLCPGFHVLPVMGSELQVVLNWI